MSENRRLNVIGKARRRVDGRAKVTGQTIFADDVMLPRMLYCKLLRSPVPHARASVGSACGWVWVSGSSSSGRSGSSSSSIMRAPSTQPASRSSPTMRWSTRPGSWRDYAGRTSDHAGGPRLHAPLGVHRPGARAAARRGPPAGAGTENQHAHGTTGITGAGAGSGLDADTLDTLDSTAFMPAGTDLWVNETGDTMTGTLTTVDVELGGNITKGGQLFRSVDDANHVVLLLEIEDVARARASSESDDLRETMQKAGVIDKLDI